MRGLLRSKIKPGLSYKAMWAIVAASCALVCASVFGVGAAAAAEGSFGEEGSDAAQFDEPSGAAVDQASGDVYLVDRNNQRVEKFDAAGKFLAAWGWGVADGTTGALQACTTTCFGGIKGPGAGQFNSPEGVAVDNATNPLDTSVGDVYVVDVRNHRVEKFSSSGAFLLMFGGEVNEATKGDVCLAGEKCEAGTAGTANGQFEIGGRAGDYIAVGSTGTVYVGDENRVQEFSPEGVYQSQLPLGGAGAVTALAVDSGGDLYVKSAELSGVQEYNSSGTLINTLDVGGEPKALALGPADELFVDDGEDFDHHLLEYNSSGKEVDSFDSGAKGGSRGVAFGDTAGVLYVLNREAVRFFSPPAPGPLVEPNSESATEVQRTMATLNATVDPEGHEESSSEAMSYHFEYGETESYGASTSAETSIGESFEDRHLSAGIAGLQPRTIYHFRVVATNAAHETTDGLDETFMTLPPALIDSESASNVTSSSVKLEAQINPLGSDTTYRFEYDTSAYEDSARHGTSVPVPDGEVGSGTGDVAVAQPVQELEPNTVYHYRVVASNALGNVEGPDHAFTTQPVGAQTQLPDGRAWELVSPPDKHGATIQSFAPSGAVIQASEGGGAITYAASAPTEANPPGNVGPERVQILSTRAPGGWVSRDIATPHNVPTAENQTGHESEYKLFSGDLSLGIVEPAGETPLSPNTSERTPYRRSNAGDSYMPLVTAANAPGAEFGNQIEFVSATPDLSHVVIKSAVSLTPPPSGAGLYEWDGGQLQFVSLLPDGKPALSPALGNDGFSKGGIVTHAISKDGSRIVWEAEGHLYIYDTSREETVQLDVVESGARGGEGAPRFQTASSDGSKVFFTDTQRLVVGSTARVGAPDLYEFEMTGSGSGKLKDLTVDHNAGEHANVQGVVLGASQGGSYIYLVASGVLSDVENGEQEKAVSGGDNLYVLHDNGVEWTTTFVTQLSSEDRNDWEARPSFHTDSSQLTARISPSGRWLAFMSDRSLTGYDNVDASPEAKGARDEEVFLYDANSGRVVCASCDPSGARPVGVFDLGEVPLLLVDFPGVWKGRWLAGSIPGWTPDAAAHALYQSRYLSDSGRLFFDSADSLVPQDTNGKEDVYEYEPDGEGSCRHEGGCVGLISSGTSGEESAFLDASESGNDVFFLTAARLVPQDVDASLDVYDARVCSVAAPCLAPPLASPPACASGDSCRAAPSLQPPIFGPSGSATFSGAGNIVQPPSKVKPKQVRCKRGLVPKKIKGKTRCVKLKRNAHGARHTKSTRGRKR
jgi:hypothetical protein